MTSYTPGPDLDLSFLYEIADGSDEFIVESLEMFLVHTPELLAEIGEAISNSDWVIAGATSHKLKSSVGFFGMPLSQGLILEIELMSKSGAPDFEQLNSKFTELKNLISTNLVTLAKIKEEKEASL